MSAQRPKQDTSALRLELRQNRWQAVLRDTRLRWWRHRSAPGPLLVGLLVAMLTAMVLASWVVGRAEPTGSPGFGITPSDAVVQARAMTALILPAVGAGVVGAVLTVWASGVPARARRWRRARVTRTRLVLTVDSLRLEASARAWGPYGARLAERVESLARGVDTAMEGTDADLEHGAWWALVPWHRDRVQAVADVWMVLDEQAASLWRATLMLDAEPGWQEAWRAECLPLQRLAALTSSARIDQIADLSRPSEQLRRRGAAAAETALTTLDERARTAWETGKRGRLPLMRGPALARGLVELGELDRVSEAAGVLVREDVLVRAPVSGPRARRGWGARVQGALRFLAGYATIVAALTLVLAPWLTDGTRYERSEPVHEPVAVCVADLAGRWSEQQRAEVVRALSTARYQPDASVLVIVPPSSASAAAGDSDGQGGQESWDALVGSAAVSESCPSYFELAGGTWVYRTWATVVLVVSTGTADGAPVLRVGSSTTEHRVPDDEHESHIRSLASGSADLPEVAVSVTADMARSTGMRAVMVEDFDWEGLGLTARLVALTLPLVVLLLIAVGEPALALALAIVWAPPRDRSGTEPGDRSGGGGGRHPGQRGGRRRR